MPIPIEAFKISTRKNLHNYPICSRFWWPVIEARVKQNKVSADDLLLNPVFRWAFLDRSDKLDAYEDLLGSLEQTLGKIQFHSLHKLLVQDIASHSVENIAHNRLLSAMTEINAIRQFASEGHTITLIPRCDGKKTPDFKADIGLKSILVEVKYIRPPDKLEEYLLRWWQSQKEIDPTIPQGLLPHLKFEWEHVKSRNELSHAEISILKDFFFTVLQQPEQNRELNEGRLVVRYIHDRKLPIVTVPLNVRARYSEAAYEGLFGKIESVLESASCQLGDSKKGQLRTIFLGIILCIDIQFLWPDRYKDRIRDLQQKSEDRGIHVIIKELGYL